MIDFNNNLGEKPLIYHLQRLFDKLTNTSSGSHISKTECYNIFPNTPVDDVNKIFRAINKKSKQISFFEFADFFISKLDIKLLESIIEYLDQETDEHSPVEPLKPDEPSPVEPLKPDEPSPVEPVKPDEPSVEILTDQGFDMQEVVEDILLDVDINDNEEFEPEPEYAFVTLIKLWFNSVISFFRTCVRI